jgi:alkanesulfonate monooxygenase SsuD/methylene tetrahydromethanopterin reductase-like flavin-dependent oxidoreductase (luciferase family)
MTAEVADGWISMHLSPQTVKDHVPLLEEGIAKRTDGMKLKDFVIRATMKVSVNNDVKSALDALKPFTALYVGGMGAKEKNFHKESMIQRGYKDAADRIQELFLAGRRDEAVAAVPDEYIDDEHLVGPPARIKERWKPWLTSGISMVTFLSPDDETLELLGTLPRE